MSTNDPDEIRADIERTREELGRDVDALGDKANPTHIARRQADRVRSGVGRAKDRVMGAAHSSGSGSGHSTTHDLADRGRESAASVADSARHTASSVADSVGSAPRAVREQAQGNPLGVGFVAFGVGLVVASLIPSSSREQRAAKRAQEQAAPLVDDVRSSASELAHDLEKPARDSVDAVRDSAKDAARSVGEHGKEAAAGVRDQASGKG